MKFLLSIILTAMLSLLLQLFLPWWSVVIAAALVGTAIQLGRFQSFAGGFLGTAIVWWVYAWIIDMRNQSILSGKIAELFHLGSPLALILVCGLVAGLAGGLAGLTGSEARKMI